LYAAQSSQAKNVDESSELHEECPGGGFEGLRRPAGYR
jgi:hypothetical protein